MIVFYSEYPLGKTSSKSSGNDLLFAIPIFQDILVGQCKGFLGPGKGRFFDNFRRNKS